MAPGRPATEIRPTGPQPLLLVSAGRSGTTLLMRLLAAHPDVALTDEAGVFDLCWAFDRWARLDRESSARLDLEQPLRLPGLLRAGEAQHLAPALGSALKGLLLDFYNQRFPRSDFRWFGEKMPNAEAARWALSLFPEGRALGLVRDPRDYLCSARAHARRPELLALHPELDVSNAAHLERWLALCEGLFAALGPGQILRYEDLVAEPAAQAAALLEWLGLDAGLAPVPAAELAELRRQHGTSEPGSEIGRYRRELDSDDCHAIEARLGPWMERLGYLGAAPDAELFSQRVLRGLAAQGPSAASFGLAAEVGAGGHFSGGVVAPGEAAGQRSSPAPPSTSSPQNASLERRSDQVEQLWQRANRVLAAGTYSVSQGALRYPDGLYPLLAESGRGAWLRDSSGRRYVDWIMGFGPALLGYRHPAVEAALTRALREAPLLSLLTRREIELAEQLRRLVPGAEGVAFGKNGSDVLALAVRLARSATGRERVAVSGYHGFHDWYLASIPEARGFPESLRSSVVRFPYGDLDHIEALLRTPPGLAAVVLEPAGFHQPPPGYLAGLGQLCQATGSVLIFDEVVTGLRLAPGGAQQAYGVRADLVCYGKALANGQALSALLGPERLLREIVHVGYGLTFRGEGLALAAAQASLEAQLAEDASGHAARIGEALRTGFSELARQRGLEAALVGIAPRLTFSIGALAGLPPLAWQTLFLQTCLEQGVLSNGSFLPSLAHGPAELELTLRAFAAALDRLAEGRDRGSLAGLLRWPVQGMFFPSAAP